jgi:hypothetical protein
MKYREKWIEYANFHVGPSEGWFANAGRVGCLRKTSQKEAYAAVIDLICQYRSVSSGVTIPRQVVTKTWALVGPSGDHSKLYLVA